jgi:thiol-disulfide isomerase/thioredoxin
LLVAVGVAGCGGGADGGRRGTSFVQGDGSFTLVAQSKRQQPIALAGDTLDGERLDVAGLRGRPVVLNVWGSWCGPCKTEAPELEAASKQLSRVGVRMIGINTKDNVAQAKAHERTYGVTYPSLVDTGALLLALRGAVPPDAIPSTLVLDAQGRIAARISGAVTRATLLDVFTDATGVRVPEGPAG